MASRLEGHGPQVAPGSAETAPGGGSIRVPYAGEPATAAGPFDEGGYSYPAGGTAAAGHAPYAGRYSSAEAGPSRAKSATWGPVSTGRAPAH